MKPAAPVTNARTGPPYRRVVWAAAVLVAVQLVIRGVLAFRGYFYWDDLILVGKAGTQGLLSPSYLFDDHDGAREAGPFPGGRGDPPIGAAGVDGPGHQPGGAAAAGLTVAAADALRHPRLASG